MSLLGKVRDWIEDPPPKFAFEIGPAGVAVWQQGRGQSFSAIEGLDRDPDPAALEVLLRRTTPPVNGNKRRPAAVILPDSCARLSLLDFDAFPRKAEEQLALIRFRLKRTVPFDIESAIIRFAPAGTSLVVAAIAVETLAPYEAAFRNAGFHPGYVTLSTLSMANLASPDTVVMKLSGGHFTMSYFEGTRLRLYRSLDLEDPGLEEVLGVVDPTLAFLEDEMKLRPGRIDTCGLEEFSSPLTAHLRDQWSLPVAPLRAQAGLVDEFNAGLHGYLDAVGAS